MIQFYINSRPVPRAVARHHMTEASSRPEAEIKQLLSCAFTSPEAARLLAAYGIEAQKI
jgi:hypothetical protein